MNLLRTPRHLLALFLALTLLPAGALVWAGWRLIEQDRDLEQTSIQKRRNESADLISTAIHQAIIATTQRLADPSAWKDIATDDAFIVAVSSHGVQTIPQTRLLYYPIQPQLPMSMRADEDVQMAIQLRQKGQVAAALEVYADLAKLDGVQAAGNPADLVARIARCDVLARLNRINDLHREAEQLDADLQASRWQLDRKNYENYADEVNSWLGRDTSTNIEGESLAQSVNDVWKKWQESPDSRTLSGSDSVRTGNQARTLVWTSDSDKLAVLVTGPLYLQGTWLPSVAPMLKNSELRLVLQDADGRMVFGEPIRDGLATQRDSKETHLPWTLQVASLNPIGDRAPFENRRQLYLTGLVLLLAVIAAGSYFVGRSVTRELAVARLQSDFVAAVSHEFRTPLTSLRQVTELLSDGRQSDPSRLSSYYQTQTRAADRLQRLVESLLDFGKMEAGAKLYRMQIIDICDWLRTTIQEMQSDDALGQYHIELQCESDGVGRVNADPEALARALRNLIDNAVKYSPDCRTVWVSLTRQDNRLAIRVRDRGIGIPANERKQIFRKFVRGAAAKTNGIKGTGVGLAMVQQIVLAHGGEVQLESQSGLGSTFTILLPEGRN
jgi:signal transduction histidine kinase